MIASIASGGAYRQRIDATKAAGDPLLGCFSRFLPHRNLSKNFAGLARRETSTA
jgi:hypothetical protein